MISTRAERRTLRRVAALTYCFQALPLETQFRQRHSEPMEPARCRVLCCIGILYQVIMLLSSVAIIFLFSCKDCARGQAGTVYAIDLFVIPVTLSLLTKEKPLRSGLVFGVCYCCPLRAMLALVPSVVRAPCLSSQDCFTLFGDVFTIIPSHEIVNPDP